MKIIYILGLGHSGSTLLNMILGSHSKIEAIGELINFHTKYRCSCGKTLESCPFWSNIIKGINIGSIKVFRSALDFLFNRNKFYLIKHERKFKSLTLIENMTEILNRNYILYKKILEVSKKDFIVDTSKSMDRLAFIMNHRHINPILIHLVRNGKGVTWSYSKKYKRYLHYMQRWFIENLKIELFLRRKRIPYMYLNYEKFTLNPKKYLKKILTQMGLQYEPGMLSFRSEEHHQVSGNPMRTLDNHIITTDYSWKKNLSLKYKLIFDFLFGWLNIYYKFKKN